MLAKGPEYPDGTECPALKIYEEFRAVGYNAEGRLQMHRKVVRHSRIAPERMWDIGKEQTLELAETCGLDVVSMHNMHDGDEGSSLGPFQDESSAIMAKMEGKWWPDVLQKARGATPAKMTDLFVVQKLQHMIKVEEQVLQKKFSPGVPGLQECKGGCAPQGQQ